MSALQVDPRLAIVVHADRVKVLVVGGGAVAERRALGLAERGARVRVVAKRATDGLRDAAGRGALDLSLRGYESGDVADAELVIAATDDRATNARVAADARAAHRLCNVADAPEEGSFSAIAQRTTGALLLAVGANGVPAAASRLLDVIGARFDARYGEAFDALRALRERLLARDARGEWERASEQLLGDDFTTRVEDGRLTREARGWR
ncbi:MAG TPA: NAD(P)-dependent oxidoreductase [Gemmatimonadaceae bacterium]